VFDCIHERRPERREVDKLQERIGSIDIDIPEYHQSVMARVEIRKGFSFRMSTQSTISWNVKEDAIVQIGCYSGSFVT
jgi:hypothetical protein